MGLASLAVPSPHSCEASGIINGMPFAPEHLGSVSSGTIGTYKNLGAVTKAADIVLKPAFRAVCIFLHWHILLARIGINMPDLGML